MHIATLLTALAGISAVSAAAFDPGYWDVNITEVRSASGIEAQLTSAIYSGSPDTTIIDRYEIDGGNITTVRSDETFSIDVKGSFSVGPSSKTLLIA
jgi:hypothetical protein